MATPIAHKGATAGAKVLAMTMVDLVMQPDLIRQSWSYFRDEQTKNIKYQPLISAGDMPAIWINKKTMDEFRPQMRKFTYNPSVYSTYLDQLGINYLGDLVGQPALPNAK